MRDHTVVLLPDSRAESNVCLLGRKGAFCCFCLLTPLFLLAVMSDFFLLFLSSCDRQNVSRISELLSKTCHEPFGWTT